MKKNTLSFGDQTITKVFQTDFTDTTGNCLQACAASILNCEIENIPNFVASDNWKEEYIRFWESKNKVVVFFNALSNDGLYRFFERMPFYGFCIVAVESFLHPGKMHAVVGILTAAGLEIVHDPNPNNSNKTSADYTIGEIDLIY